MRWRRKPTVETATEPSPVWRVARNGNHEYFVQKRNAAFGPPGFWMDVPSRLDDGFNNCFPSLDAATIAMHDEQRREVDRIASALRLSVEVES